MNPGISGIPGYGLSEKLQNSFILPTAAESLKGIAEGNLGPWLKVMAFAQV